MEVGVWVILLESASIGEVASRAVVFLLGAFCVWQGLRLRRERIPRFVLQYRGWSSSFLALPFGGFALIVVSVGGIRWPIHPVMHLFFLLAGLFCFLVFILGILVWYPWFLLPRWYRRALKAGVPRNNLEEMAAFKALPVEEQKRRANPFQ